MSIKNSSTIKVSDVMLPMDRIPLIHEHVILKEALEEMGRSRLGIVCIVDATQKLQGILTDGDIRRKLLKVQKPFSAFFVDDALDHAIREPLTIGPDDTLVYAVELMEQRQVWDLPVVNPDGILVGLLHLHRAVQALLGGRRD
ncbi:CBS domain-containing protein [Chlorobium phaeovibrioides]|uniref:CBS domain-containing protein n=1 Tax=Chlorobium phaeovibrioides TaxID=1094 RepID=UPI000F82238A|nr:CBS domain-containing protein [Chlorobium phaeovibrioides]RTY34212.1 CBS domain-containing protein [Chlorobium phaeovibrioides]